MQFKFLTFCGTKSFCCTNTINVPPSYKLDCFCLDEKITFTFLLFWKKGSLLHLHSNKLIVNKSEGKSQEILALCPPKTRASTALHAHGEADHVSFLSLATTHLSIHSK